MSKKREVTELRESVLSAPKQVDREAGVIRGVKVIGRFSKNGREYTDQALRDAARLYEGVKVNVDHIQRNRASEDRPFVDGFGELRNVRSEGDSQYADLHYLKTHPLADLVCESAERFPMQFGLSHHAEAIAKTVKGKLIVESISNIRSVDIVSRPATNAGLFESCDPTRETTLRQVIESLSDTAFKERLTLLEGEAQEIKEMADAPILLPEKTTSGEGEEEAAEQLKAAVRAMVLTVIDDETMTPQAKATKIGQILATVAKIQNPDSEGDATATGETPADSKEVEESMTTPAKTEVDKATDNVTENQDGKSAVTVAESMKPKITEDVATELLEAAGITPIPSQVKALAAMESTEERKTLLETWKQQAAPPAPQKPSASPSRVLLESQRDVGEYPKDRKAFNRACGIKPSAN